MNKSIVAKLIVSAAFSAVVIYACISVCKIDRKEPIAEQSEEPHGIALEVMTRPQSYGFDKVTWYSEPEESREESSVEVSSEERQLVSLGRFRLTGYCPCEKCCGEWAYNRPKDNDGNDIVRTASGTVAKEGRTIGVDPDLIPYGTVVVIRGHEYVAEDCGGSLNGKAIDIYFSNHESAVEFALQYDEVFVYR